MQQKLPVVVTSKLKNENKTLLKYQLTIIS